MSSIEQFYNWLCSYVEDDDIIEAKKSKLLVFSILISFSLILIAYFINAIIDLKLVPYTYIVVTVALQFTSLFSIKWLQSLIIPANLYIISNILFILLLVYFFGWAYSPLIVWLLVQPIIAVSVLNKNYGMAWFFVVSIIIIYRISSSSTSFPPDLSDFDIQLLLIINLFGFGIFIYFFQVFTIRHNTILIDKLQAQQKQNKTILDNLPAGVSYLNKDLKITYINPAVSKIFKISYDELIGQKVTDRFQSEFFDYNKPYYQKTFNGEIVNFEREVIIKNEMAYIRSTYVPLRNETDEITGIITLSEDISHAKKHELEKLSKQHKKQTELKSELDTRNRELASQHLFMTNQKNLLNDIKNTIISIDKKTQIQKKKQLQSIINSIDQNIDGKELWESFQIQFESIHPNFTTYLQKQYSNLTQRDLRHCAYLKMNLNYKEIAQLLNVSYKTVEMTSYRIKKKMNLDSKLRLGDYLRQL